MTRSLSLVVLVLLGLVGCDSPRDPVGAVRAPVIYDDDDRREYYELAGTQLGDQGRSSTVALVRAARLEQTGSTYTFVGEPTLEEGVDLCPDERFTDEPTVAFCSGTLIDDDLVLTAGHCIVPLGAGPGAPHCGSTRFVFDYLERADGVLETIDADDVYACRAVVAHRLDDELDYAIVSLDRPVTGRTPARIRRSTSLAVGTPVLEIGFPTGLPMKFDVGGRVTDPGPKNGAYFVTDLDAFHGNSGSGVRDESGDVLGILVRTYVPDYEFDEVDRCYRALRLPDVYASEMVTYVDHALDALCVDAAYPSARICSVSPSCGDGVCTVGEASSACIDCAGPLCGDGRVEAGETNESCPYDLGRTVKVGSSGCAVSHDARSLSVAWLVAFAALVVLLRARYRFSRRTRIPASLVVAIVVATMPDVAKAEAVVEPRGARFIGTVDGTIGTSTLRDPHGEFASVRGSGVGGAVRVGVDVGLGRTYALEISAAARGFLYDHSQHYELTLAPRIRYVWRRKREVYLRVPIGAGVALYWSDDPRPSGVFGLFVGYRRQFTRVFDVFAELGTSVRFARNVDPLYGFVSGYGLHPSAPPSVVAPSFGLVLGLGLGRGTRAGCVSPARPASRTEP